MENNKDEHIRHIETLQKSIEETDVPLQETNDFKKWKLFPGQQLFYRRRKWPTISHHAVYVGNGKVFEGGFNPSTFYKLFMSLLNAEVKLSPLKEYIRRTRKNHIGSLFVIKTHADSNKGEILQRLERVKNLLKVKHNWHPLKTNCEGMANYISFGEQFTLQGLEWRGFFLRSFIILVIFCVIIWLVSYKLK
jgi:hypothetical protein